MELLAISLIIIGAIGMLAGLAFIDYPIDRFRQRALAAAMIGALMIFVGWTILQAAAHLPK